MKNRHELSAYIQGLDHVREVNQSEQAAKTLGSFNRLVSVRFYGDYRSASV